MSETVDVLVCGGGLAGLCLARQLRREVPDAGVTVVERTARPLPEATHKVGESSVELGSRYFEHTLGLRDYLLDQHLIKNGLRYFPGGGATHALEDRVEIGPPELPRVPSFQLDRGRFENDLRAFCEADGVTLVEGVGVDAIALGEDGAPHRATLSDGRTVEARWLVDATGRRRLLARTLGLGEPSGHEAHASWFRVEGRLDVDHLVPSSDEKWHARDLDGIRWLSTSHLMGEGYWVWIIPLSSGRTSIGVVAHGEVHPFETLNTLERTLAWLEEHEPVLRSRLEAHPIADFRCLKDYSYTARRVFSADRWALVGEAGLFVDPFYSPGSDFIALANVHAVELIRRERAGEDIAAHADFVDWFYRRLAHISTETYRHAAKVYGQPRPMAAKIYWDNFNYWAFVCQYFFQGLFRLPLEEQRAFVDVAQRFASLNLRAQQLFAGWAARAEDGPERRHVVLPPIPSLLANLHLDLEREMTPAQTRAYMEEKADLAEELLTQLLLRAVTELGPDPGAALVEALGAADWPLAGLEARLGAEAGGKRGRRRRLSRLARDVERALGREVAHDAHTSLAESVGRALPGRASAPAPAE
ncbi:MAG TPA: NAD(P)/FAD-dependent oxidoreductase [Sandaracinaceae bacterium LLY-WYZ-13_1]|nr:NAD(P)/FAD-dependent oxidoreductase [Sandaracinaceae bacterium LLY-WYZ-13_1]